MSKKLFTILSVVVILTAFTSVSNADLPGHPLQGVWQGALYLYGEGTIGLNLSIEMNTFIFGTDPIAIGSSVLYLPPLVVIKFETPGVEIDHFYGTKLGNSIFGTVKFNDLTTGDVTRGIFSMVKIGPLSSSL